MQITFPVTPAVIQLFERLFGQRVNDEHLETFASHWGGLEREHFLRAFEQGTGDDKVLAIFYLSQEATPEAAERLAPLLFQTPRRERRASAICLGMMGDRRAFPALRQVLLDGLDLEEYRRSFEIWDEDLDDLVWCEQYRWYVIELLGQWEGPSLVEDFKHAFQALWRIQQTRLPYAFVDLSSYDALAYQLGRMGDFALLEEISLPAEFRDVAMVYMILGFLQVEHSSPIAHVIRNEVV